MTKIITFYLPQFHTIKENDEWWGEGFTEWINVRKSQPLFPGHRQPRVPLHEKYYNLLDEDVMAWQVDLAKKYGIYGFCFYHYWFDGKLMLEKPIQQYLNTPSLDLPFCLCWANPPWTKVWAGKGSAVLIDQQYGNEEMWEQHFQYLLPYFNDARYIKEDGSPVFVVYDPADIPCIREMLVYYRRRIREEGFPGITLMYQYPQAPKAESVAGEIFDYRIEFQPVYALHQQEGSSKAILHRISGFLSKYFGITVSDYFKHLRKTTYDEVWQTILNADPVDEKSIPGAVVDWDNTPRRGIAGRVFLGTSPEKFYQYLKAQLRRTQDVYHKDYLFLTAWNEWAEGSYLEPDNETQYGYLQAVWDAQHKP